MAGSYEHLQDGFSMIENMGDAMECIVELLYLVEAEIGRERALQILNNRLYPMIRDEIPKDRHLIYVEGQLLR